MVRGEVVRLKNGKVVNPADLRRSAQRKLGHTYSLVYVEPDSEDVRGEMEVNEMHACVTDGIRSPYGLRTVQAWIWSVADLCWELQELKGWGKNALGSGWPSSNLCIAFAADRLWCFKPCGCNCWSTISMLPFGCSCLSCCCLLLLP